VSERASAKPRVFISYGRKAQAVAISLRDALIAEDIEAHICHSACKIDPNLNAD